MKSGSYKVEVFYPKEVREILGVTSQRYRKTFSSKNEALVAEKDILKNWKVQLENMNELLN